MRARLVVIGVGLLAVLTLATFAQDHHPQGATVNPVRISFVSSPEKEDLVRPLVERFNAASGASVGGRRVSVDLQIEDSGTAESSIASGELQPVIWSPASSLWGRLLNYEAGERLVSRANPSIVRTPLVIAMWEPMARALGWPAKKISLREVLKLATSEQGWAAYGEPGFGRFKLGHTDPDVSTSGLSAVVAEYYAEAGNPGELEEREIEQPRVREAIREIERSVVHYGDNTLSFARQLARYGPAYASALAMEETTLVAVNRAQSKRKLVGIYPADGTFVSDNPFIVLRASWVSRLQRRAAGVFQRWLLAQVTPALAARNRFRTSKPGSRPLPPLDRARGIDPREPKELPLPSPRVLATIRNDWRANRKPANVMLVVDTSRSMGAGGKLDGAKRALQAFLNSLPPRYRVGLISFNDQVLVDSPIAMLDQRGRTRLRAAVRDLEPGGEDALFDATRRAVHAVEGQADPTRINAVVVLADGGDNRSSVKEPALAAELRQQPHRQRLAVRVYTIAYGREANRRLLDRLAASSHGYGFSADLSTIEAKYRRIARYL